MFALALALVLLALAVAATLLLRRGGPLRRRLAAPVARVALRQRIDRLFDRVDSAEAAGELSRGAAARLRRQIEDLRAESFGR